MNLTPTITKRFFLRKIVTAVLVTASVASFASLGDGGKKDSKSHTTVSAYNSKNFSLRSGYNYKSNNLFTPTNSGKFIMLNTVVTFQRGNATYILPLKKKLFLDKIKFNPPPPKF